MPSLPASGRRPGRGFTLVEVLVALMLMALMSAMAWQGLDGMLRSREVTQAAIDRTALLQTVLAQWEQDLDQIQPSGVVGAPLDFDGLRLRFTRRQPEGLQVVVWMLAEGRWSRWASRPVTRLAELRAAWERSEQPLTLASESLTLLEGVAGWQLFYFWDNAWANALSTGGEAPPAKTPEGQGQPQAAAQALPKGLRMQIELAPASGLGGTLTRQVQLVSSP